MAKMISFASAKGGVGKSTSTVEVATILKRAGYKVLVIDLDENSTLTLNIGGKRGTNKTSYEVLKGIVSAEDAIQKLDHFDLIAGSRSLSLVPVEFTDRDDIYLLADLKEILDDRYDFIFVDNGPVRSMLLTMTIVAADYIIIPTMTDAGSLELVNEMEKDINTLVNNRNHDSHAKVIGYLLTQCKVLDREKKKVSIINEIALEELEEHASKQEGKPFVLYISSANIVSEVKTLKTSVYDEQKNNEAKKVGWEYHCVAEEMLERIG